jgi:hypothetical protein
VKTGLFSYISVPELNTKNMSNSPSFLSVTYKILSAKRFRSYRISKIDFAADFYFWTEQRLNGSQPLGLGLAETSKVTNTIMVGGSLSFPMVHNMAPNGYQFMSYNCQKHDQFAETEFWADLTSWSKSRFDEFLP